MKSKATLNIYKSLNNITEYIDNNLKDNIDYRVLARFLGTNVYTMKRLFALITGIPISEYIRKRRLSLASYDLYEKKLRITDIAFEYQYGNATSFSRAFKKFHGINPSLMNKTTKLKNFPRITFKDAINSFSELNYEIVVMDELDLYGTSIPTNNNIIGRDAPIFFQETENRYFSNYGEVKYGMITYDDKRAESQKYYCLYNQAIQGFEHIKIPKSTWLKFSINSQKAQDIQNTSTRFYEEFLPSCKYSLKTLPELEFYHNGKTDFLVAIY